MQISWNGGCHLRLNTKYAKFSLCCGISVQTGWDLEDLKDIEHISTQLIIQCSSMFSYIKPHFENIKISLMFWFNDLRHSNQSELVLLGIMYTFIFNESNKNNPERLKDCMEGFELLSSHITLQLLTPPVYTCRISAFFHKRLFNKVVNCYVPVLFRDG